MARHDLSPVEAGRTTLKEFDIYALSYSLKMQEWRYRASFLAWQNQAVQATKGKGKNVRPAFKKFEDFYDYTKDFEQVFDPPEPTESKSSESLADLNMKLNARGRG